jgi:hypothetical protein
MLVTRWFLPRYTVGLLALAVGLEDVAVRTAVMVFSATSLIQVPGGAGAVQAALRYGSPLGASVATHRDRVTRASARPDTEREVRR